MSGSGIKAAALGLLMAAGIGSSASAETLADALAQAYRSSGLLEQNRAVLRATDEGVASAVAALRPTLNWLLKGDYTHPTRTDAYTTSLSLSTQMLLYDFGRSGLKIDSAKETVLATRAALVDVENTVLLNTVRAYLGVRRAEAFVQLNENNVKLLNEQLRATKDRFDVGEVTRTDVSQAEASLAAAKSKLAAQKGGLTQAREQYRAVVGHLPGTLAAPPTPPKIPATQSAALAQARATNPQLLQVQHQVKAADLVVEQANHAYYPSLTASASAGIDGKGNKGETVGLSLSGPIYQGGQIASSIRSANAQRDRLRAQLYTVGLAVDQQVGNAYSDLSVAVASIAASKQQVAAAKQALEGVREEFQLGARTTLEVLDQEQSVLDAQTSQISAEVDRYVAVYEVLQSVGLLTAEHLGLRVPIYDPSAYYNAVKDAPMSVVSPEGKKLDRVMKALGKN